MKKLLTLICTACVFLPTYSGDWHYTPIQLNGLNADLVMGPGEASKGAIDNDGWCFYSDTRQPRGGLPQQIHGMFSDVPYTLADFSGNCALLLRSAAKDAEKGSSFGSRKTLTFGTALKAKTFWVLATAGNGPASMKVTINYSDGTSSSTVTKEVKDWYSSGYSGTGFWQLGRLDTSENSGDNTNFALYEYAFSADQSKTSSSITIELGDKGSFLSVFAVTATNKDIPETIKEKKTFYISDSHLDTQWNWTVRTTISQYLKNTLEQNFARFEDSASDEFAFNFESSIHYKWFKEYYPDLYAKLKTYIKNGRWNVSGGAVNANDVNIASGESLMRNFLYGQKFYKNEFNVQGGRDIMLPDCFGFPWSLPTAAAHCGMKYFHSQKLSWNSAYAYNKLPRYARWIGTDGSEILAVLKLCPYDAHEDFRKDMSNAEDHLSEINTNISSYGIPATFKYVGPRSDRGGGLDKETADWFTTSVNGTGPIGVTLNSSTGMLDQAFHMGYSGIPTIEHGLPMRAHGVGGYTSRCMLKFWNRKGELLGDAAEKASVAANWLGALPYQQQTLTDTWTRLLWHQFHDDIPGTCINEAYTFSVNDGVLNQLDFSRTLNNAVGAVAKNIDTNSCTDIPLVVYNPLSIDRTDIVEATVEVGEDVRYLKVTGPNGAEVPNQILKTEDGKKTFIFLATVPSLGYASYNVAPSSVAPMSAGTLSVSNTGMENGRYKITLNANGDVSSIIDKNQGNKELLSAPIRLAMLFDESLTWPSWEIHGDQLQKDPREYVDNEGLEVEIAENGPLRAALKIKRTKNNSTFYQYIRLAAQGASDRIDFVNEVDWQCKERMLKATFPLTASNSQATYDLDLGVDVNNNSTDYNTDSNNTDAHCEFLGHRWADVTNSDNSFGVSILNDCKYGWDKQKDNVIRLTLIHTPKVGGNYTYEGEQDLGLNKFTYSFFGHKGNWGADTQWEADKLNEPMVAYQTSQHAGALGKSFGFVQVNTDKVAVKALKKAEESDKVIIRFYELTNSGQDVEATFPADILTAEEVNGVEDYLCPASFSGKKLTFHIDRFHPKTFALTLAPTTLSVHGDAPVSETVDLTSYYNIDVYSSNSKREDTSIAKAYPSELVPDVIEADGIHFETGPKTDGMSNAIRCEGQTIALPTLSNEKKIYILAASTAKDGAEGEFLIDGRATTLRFENNGGYVGQYSVKQGERKHYRLENTAFTATHSHVKKDKSDGVYDYLYMYKYAIPLDGEATTLTLPNEDDMLIYAITLSDNDNDDTTPASDVVKLLTHTDTVDPYQEVSHVDPVLKPNTIKASAYTNNSEKPDMAADAYEDTKWCDNSSAMKWLEYKFDEPVVVTGWSVLNAGSEGDDKISREYHLQRYVNHGWVDVEDVVENTLNETDYELADPFVTTGVRLRVVQSEQSSDKAARIYDFSVYGHKASDEELNIPMVISRVPSYGYGKQVASVMSCSGFTKPAEGPYNLFTGPLLKWCDTSTANPWAIIELSDIYSLSRFDIYDSKTRESYANIADYTISVSTDGEKYTEVASETGVADENVHTARLDAPVDARYVKLQLKRGSTNAIRIYGFDIWGVLKQKVQPESGKPVSLHKTILGCYDVQNHKDTPLTLIDAVKNDTTYTWKFAKGSSSDPIKWMVLDLEADYDITKFTLYDSKTIGTVDNLSGYKIYVSSVEPRETAMTSYKLISGGANWTLAADVTGQSGTNIKTYTPGTPLRARYVKLEVHNTRMSDNAQLYELEVYGDIVSGIDNATRESEIDVYPAQISRGQDLHIVAPASGSYSIYTMGGAQIGQGFVGAGTTSVSTSMLTSGIYLVKVIVDGDVISKKLIVK